MTTKDTATYAGTDYADEMDFDLSTGDGLDFYTPADAACPLLVGVPLLPNPSGGYQSWLTGTGFDGSFGGGYNPVFGVSGDTCHEDSNASPTVTFTWVPDPKLTSDPPPGQVIVVEQAAAEADASGDPSGFSGTADDGLGDKAVEMSSDPSSWTDQLSRGWRYTRHDGSSGTVTVTGSPSASADASSAASSDGGNATATLGYAASAYPVTINVSGDAGPSFGNYFLVGQYVSFSLNTGGLPSSPSDTYSWSISGGRPFDTFSASDGHGQYYPLWSMQSNSSPNVWSSFAHPDTATITCQATISGQAVTATASITVEPPTFSTDDLIGTTEAKVLPKPTYVQLIRDEAGAHTGAAHGFDWNRTSVQIPPDYDEGDNDPGEWNWTQLWTPNRKLTYSDGSTVNLASDTAGSLTGQEVLDTGYPYYHEWFYAEPGYGGDSDSPFSDLFSDSNGVPDPSYAELKVDESFRDFLMYKPPGGSSVAVPLQGVKWSWGFDAKVYGITHPDNSFSPTNWNVSDLKQHSDPTVDYPDFPTWNSYAATLQLYFPN